MVPFFKGKTIVVAQTMTLTVPFGPATNFAGLGGDDDSEGEGRIDSEG